MNEQVCLPTRAYYLEPEDIWYRFMISRLPQDHDGAVFGSPKGVVLVTILDPYWQLSYLTSIRKCQDLYKSHVAYFAGKSKDVDIDTVCAVLLAVGVLAINPDDLEGACEAMLRVSEIME